jgi:hypothetical protein
MSVHRLWAPSRCVFLLTNRLTVPLFRVKLRESTVASQPNDGRFSGAVIKVFQYVIKGRKKDDHTIKVDGNF